MFLPTKTQALGATVEEMQTLFSRVRGELQSKAGASDIEAALQDMTSKINESANRQSQLQRLARTLGKDQNSSAVMKRLQIELEQVWFSDEGLEVAKSMLLFTDDAEFFFNTPNDQRAKHVNSTILSRYSSVRRGHMEAL